MDGPVVAAAKKALDGRDVTPVLRWVQPADEAEIRESFARALSVREKGADARDLADRYFFETLVRVHRAGEGEPFTGLKPAGTQVAPGIQAADAAMEKGSPDEVIHMLQQAVADGVKQRFEAAHRAAEHADRDISAGRSAVAAYVQFMHYVEGIHAAASPVAGEGHGHGIEAPAHGHANE
jgi:hypothetical protein